MATLLLFLDQPVAVLLPLLFVFAFGCGLVGFERQWRNRQLIRNGSDPVYRATVVGFLGALALMAALTALYRYEARAEIAAFCAGSVDSVAVDGKPFAPADDVVAQIASPRWREAHHSHPTKTLNVRLAGPKGTLDLALRRDSDDPHEYWLFYPRYFITQSNDVGHLFTDRLDGF